MQASCQYADITSVSETTSLFSSNKYSGRFRNKKKTLFLIKQNPYKQCIMFSNKMEEDICIQSKFHRAGWCH